MRTDTLAKLYPYLTPWERLPLIVAAAARNDEAERLRLIDSAPTVGLRLPDHFGLAQALREVVELHSLTVLDLAASFWQWWGLWGWHQYAEGVAGQSPGRAGNHPCKGKSKTKADADEALRLYCMVRYHAFLFVTHVDGWKQFCAELPVDPDVLLRCLPGWDSRTWTEAQAREKAFSRADATLFLLSEARDLQGGASAEAELPQTITVEGVAKVWHTFLSERAKW